jgi:hypothetical protein
MILTTELKSMKRVLRRLGHLDSSDIVTHKGFFNFFLII